jgi:protein KRI1
VCARAAVLSCVYQGLLDDQSGDESSSSDEDSEAELLTQKLSMQVAQTIHAIRSKDPSIYSDKTSFFDEDSDSEEDEVAAD